MTRECVIRNRLGLHARAAAKFVHTATRYTSHIRVSREGKTMDGKSIMGILLLAAASRQLGDHFRRRRRRVRRDRGAVPPR